MIRPARLTDRHALAQLAESARSAPGAERRTLGLPLGVAPGAGRFSLSALVPSWIPVRQPSLHLVMEEDGTILGSCRALEETQGGEWAVVELDAVQHPLAAEIRYELLSALLEEGVTRNVARYHAACSAVPENVELFSQLAFVPYAEEEILYLPADPSGGRAVSRHGDNGQAPAAVTSTEPVGDTEPGDQGLRPVQPADAWDLFRLWSRVTPPAVARAEGYAAAAWEATDHDASVPRSSLTALLRLHDVHAWLLPDGAGAAAFVQYAASRGGAHYLRLVVDNGTDPAAVLRSGIRAAGSHALSAGLLTPVRTYEDAVRSSACDAGFQPIGRATLLVREERAMIPQPAMVPALQ